MQKYILAGVGTVLGFDKTANSNLIFNANTLTESSITTEVTSEDIRGGLSNPILGKYFHDSMMNCTITDALFNLQYLALNVGGDITIGGDSIVSETVTTSVANQITVTGTPIAFGNAGTVGWYTLAGQDVWSSITFTGSTATVSNLPEGTEVCVKYNAEDNSMSTFSVSSNIIPSEIHLQMIFPLFSAGQTSFTSSYQVGSLIVDIPRFLLNGGFDLSLTSSGASTTALSGSALVSYETSSCNDMGKYGRIMQKITGATWHDGLDTIAVDNADIQLNTSGTQTLKLWGIYNHGENVSTQPLDNTLMTYTVTPSNIATVSASGVVSAVESGTASIKIVATDTASTSNPIEGYASVTVS